MIRWFWYSIDPEERLLVTCLIIAIAALAFVIGMTLGLPR